jgi:hypothetical protein
MVDFLCCLVFVTRPGKMTGAQLPQALFHFPQASLFAVIHGPVVAVAVEDLYGQHHIRPVGVQTPEIDGLIEGFDFVGRRTVVPRQKVLSDPAQRNVGLLALVAPGFQMARSLLVSAS